MLNTSMQHDNHGNAAIHKIKKNSSSPVNGNINTLNMPIQKIPWRIISIPVVNGFITIDWILKTSFSGVSSIILYNFGILDQEFYNIILILGVYFVVK